MSLNDDEIKNGWNEYGRLVLNELERLNVGQEQLRADMDLKLKDLSDTINTFRSTERDVDDLDDWKDKVIEVWSPRQMQQVKNEVYNQKNKWMRVAGIVIALQVVMGIVLFVKEFM